MKSFFLALALLSSSFALSAEVQTFDFYWSGQSGGSYSMTTCDSVEAQVRSLADLFGLKIEDVHCSGGIQGNAGIWPLSLRINYAEPEFGPGEPILARRKLESDRATSVCSLETRLIRQWVKQLSFVKITQSQDSCMSNQGSWSYEFSVRVEKL